MDEHNKTDHKAALGQEETIDQTKNNSILDGEARKDTHTENSEDPEAETMKMNEEDKNAH